MPGVVQDCISPRGLNPSSGEGLAVQDLVFGGFYTGQVVANVGGTAVRGPAQAVPTGGVAVIKAKPGNTGSVWIGNSQTNAQDLNVAFQLSAGQQLTLKINNFNLVWVNADAAGEGVVLACEA